MTAATPTPTTPDTEEATLNINLVLRWEYRLGSTLFVVYTHNQNPALVPSPGGAGFQGAANLAGARRGGLRDGEARLLVGVMPRRLQFVQTARNPKSAVMKW